MILYPTLDWKQFSGKLSGSTGSVGLPLSGSVPSVSLPSESSVGTDGSTVVTAGAKQYRNVFWVIQVVYGQTDQLFVYDTVVVKVS